MMLIYRRPLSQGPAEFGSIQTPLVMRFITSMRIPTLLIYIFIGLFAFKDTTVSLKHLNLLKIPSYYWGISTLRIKERVFVFSPLKLSLLWRRVRDLFIYNMIKGFKQQRWFILFCSVAELIIPLPTYMER